MGDLIDRQDAINTALEFFVEFLGGAFHEDEQKILMKRMNELPSAEPEPHWIPTSKERPPQHQEIWITNVYGDVEVVYRGDGRLWLSNGDNGYYFEDEIIAWMPANVPSPYQPEEELE